MAGRERPTDEGGPSSSEDEGFLGRWSRRKAETKTAAASGAEEPLDQTGEERADTLPAADEANEPPAFDVASLPDIDELGSGSDFSMFMQAGVPPALKTRALRKLWRVKPELANLDGLLDYGEDLTGSFKTVDHLKTAYEVGRGFLRDQSEKAAAEGAKTDRDEALADADDPARPAETDPDEPAGGPEEDEDGPSEGGSPSNDEGSSGTPTA